MKKAWSMFRQSKGYVAKDQMTFAQALRLSWRLAKSAAKEAEEAARLGLVRMHYSQYKTVWADYQTVAGSYDKHDKTIVVMTKVPRDNAALALCC